jgi:pimeloyl-ACP methyl ester carboxylesterase
VAGASGRRHRPLALAGVGATAVATLSLTGASVAGLRGLCRPAPLRDPLPAEVVAAAPSPVSGCRVRVTLRGIGAGEPGVVGILTARGRYTAGAPAPTDDGWSRDAAPVAGEPPLVLRSGQQVGVISDPWRGCADPFRQGAVTSTVASPDGPLTVTRVGPTSRGRAVVFLHGRGGQRHTGWWFAPTAVIRGWQVVMPAYRNDPHEAPATGRYLLGGEWIDLAAVLGHLAADGIREVVLVGWSMGANIAASYLRHRHRAPDRFAHHPRPVGLVLDAPVLDWRPVLEQAIVARRLPRRFATLLMTCGQVGWRIDWRELDHLADCRHLSVPVLVFHGSSDDVVPLEAVRRLADAIPDVRLDVVEGAAHCRSVNLAPGRYLAAFGDLLDAC